MQSERENQFDGMIKRPIQALDTTVTERPFYNSVGLNLITNTNYKKVASQKTLAATANRTSPNKLTNIDSVLVIQGPDSSGGIGG